MKKRTIAILFLATILLLTSAIFVGAQSGGRLAPLPAEVPYQPNSSEQALASVYQAVVPAIVHVNVVTRVGSGTGSGFVIDLQGHIVTNNHVIENAEFIQVTFNDGVSLDAKLVGRDPYSDLAVLRVDPTLKNLQPVGFADSDTVFVGQSVMAIGSPFGQDFTLTTGIVSALDRSLSADNNFSIPQVIQTDAAINPGNSGGPLLDMDGRVVGVNTAILSRSRSASGVGFAVPSNQVRRVVPYLISNGSYQHSWLGISGTTVQPRQREVAGLPAELQGVMIAGVSRGGPAAQAGLRGAAEAVNTPFGQLPIGGDIITAINGTPVNQMNALIALLNAQTLPGDTITLQVWRAGQLSNVDVTLDARP